jgi:hypothetical protein
MQKRRTRRTEAKDLTGSEQTNGYLKCIHTWPAWSEMLMKSENELLAKLVVGDPINGKEIIDSDEIRVIVHGFKTKTVHHQLECKCSGKDGQLHRPRLVDHLIDYYHFKREKVSSCGCRAHEPRRSAAGWVYLLKGSQGNWKLGRTVSRERRWLETLDENYEEVARFYSADCVADEKFMHEKFAKVSVGREWFRLSDEQIKWIKGMAERRGGADLAAKTLS